MRASLLGCIPRECLTSRILYDWVNSPMKLNLGKCVSLTLNRNQSSIKFLDGTPVPRKTQAVYLGALLTDSADNHKEVRRRIGAVHATIKQLHPLWAQACTSVNWRLRVFEAVINSKILYGLESIQLTLAEQNRLDALQMNMLRKILRVPTTFVNREWTNQKVIDTLEHRFKYSPTKLSIRWKNNKLRILGHIVIFWELHRMILCEKSCLNLEPLGHV